MPHMQPEITVKQRGWQVETSDSGTCYVPGSVVSVPDYFKTGVELRSEDADIPNVLWNHLRRTLEDYIPGFDVEAIEVCEGYFARLSAPGYLDCTEWGCYRTLKEARDALRDE